MYNRVKFNQCESELFNFRFKRDPKIWSVEQVQDLWIRSKERARKRSLISSKVYDEIISEIPKNDKGCKLVYFSEDDTLYQYSFSWSTSFKSWGYSWNQVRFSDNKTISRDEKIDFILSNKKAFELGEKYRASKKLECKLQRRVLSIMCDMIEDKLKEVYKDKHPPNITKVKVGDKEYYFAVDEQNRYDYLQFHYKGEVQDNTIVV